MARPKVVRTVAAARAKISPIGAFSLTASGIIHAMQVHQGELLAQRSALDVQIDAFARAMQTLGKAASLEKTRQTGIKRGRKVEVSVGPGSMKDCIVRVLRQSSKPMSLKDIGLSIKKAGHKSKAKDLTKAVSNTLPGLKQVKRVGYGKYQLSG